MVYIDENGDAEGNYTLLARKVYHLNSSDFGLYPIDRNGYLKKPQKKKLKKMLSIDKFVFMISYFIPSFSQQPSYNVALCRSIRDIRNVLYLSPFCNLDRICETLYFTVQTLIFRAADFSFITFLRFVFINSIISVISFLKF